MAAPELRLRWLSPLGADQMIYRTLTFDMTMMTDSFVRPWTIQGIETGIEAALNSPAVNKELQSLLAGGRRRTIRFFSEGQGFQSGVAAGPGSGSNFGMTGASGVSYCTQCFGPEESPR